MVLTKNRNVMCLVFALLMVGVDIARAQDGIMNLAIGDPERRNRELTVEADTIFDTRAEHRVAPRTLAERLRDSRLVLVGENHTDLEHHRVQLRVLELLGQDRRNLMVGLEMFPSHYQRVLDDWVSGEFTEAEFLEQSDWYRVWGYNWGYYREIFLHARAHGIPLIGLDGPRGDGAHADTITVEPDLASDDHRALFRAFFEADTPVHGDLPEEQWDALFEAQCKRDAIMAYNAAQALAARPERTLVVLAGTGHVVYELGIARQIRPWYDGAAATVVPVAVEEDEPSVRGSVADFVWGVPAAEHPAFPEMGAITLFTESGLQIIHVEPDSPAGAAGLQAGDVLIRFDGRDVSDKPELNRLLSMLHWGDEVSLGIERNEEELEVALAFRR